MPTDVVMPQMGESIAEGTIVRWIKKVGDPVERDEPLFEISTDKVDAEIPSPVAGVVTEIRAKEGETVPVNTVVAVIGAAGAQPRQRRRRAAAPAPAAPLRRRRRRTAAPSPQADGAPATAPPRAAPPSAPSDSAAPQRTGRAAGADLAGSRRPRRSDVGRGRGAPPALVAARPEDREGAQHRHLADPRHRHRAAA